MSESTRRRDRAAARIFAALLSPGCTLKTEKGFAADMAEAARRAVVAADILLVELDREKGTSPAEGHP